MGLDAVELVIEIEERFGITLRQDEAARIVTVEDLTNLILARIAARDSSGCATRSAFYALRKQVRELLRSESLRIRPKNRIADIVPAAKRRALWRLLREQLGAEPPDLVRPAVLNRLLWACAIVLLIVGLLPARVDPLILPLSLAIAGLTYLALLRLTVPFCVVPPATLATFADASRRIAGVTVALNVPGGVDSQEWVPEVVCDILAEQLGIEKATIQPRSRLVQDLGMD